jgi:Pvc16 N-terminal domain
VSNHLAIATVTAALQYRLNLVVEGTLLGASATNLRPDSLNLPALGVNIFLYQITPNHAQRNADLPTRRADGTLLKRPTAALDLHYMLSFYGDDAKWEQQILLGAVARTMHAQPSLDAATINNVRANPELAATNLQLAESVRFVQTALTFDEMSKLWGIFYQKPYVLSVAYAASVVLIETDETATAALPVRSFQVGAVPLAQPVITRATSSRVSASPVAPLDPFAGDQLVVVGNNLFEGASRSMLLDGAPATVVSAVHDTSQDRYVLSVPTSMSPGVHMVQLLEQVQITPFPSVAQSNAVTFAIAPVIVAVHALGTTDVQIDVRQALGPTQRLQIALVQTGAGHASYVLDAQISTVAVAPPAVVAVHCTSPHTIAPGNYLVRLFVDGVPSALTSTVAGGPYTNPTVTI